jgi:hypothetical protein
MSALPPAVNARVRAWAWWLVPVVVLALLIGWEIDWGRQIVRVPSAPAPVEAKPLVAAVLPAYAIDGGLPAHTETVERTLFNATRRPAPVLAGDSGPNHLTANQYQLMGTTVTGDKKIAFLKEIAGGKSRVVRQGDQINGMFVASVEADRVKFTLNDESDELLLKVAPGPKRTVAAAPPQMPAAAPAPAAAAGGANPGAPVRPGQGQRAAQAAAVPQGVQAAQQAARAARRAARAAGGAGAQASDDGSGQQGGGGGGGGGRRNQ